MKKFRILALAILAVALVSSCNRESSSSTGWEFNNPNVGGFQKFPFVDQETGPGLLLVEGGTFTMGRSEQDVMFDNILHIDSVTVDPVTGKSFTNKTLIN